MRPSRGALWCLLLSILGIALSGYLFFIHLGLMRGELLGGPVCGGTGAFNCHAVTAGAWGSFLGMPLALWGILGYLTVFALAVLALDSAELAGPVAVLIFLLSLLFVLVDVGLFFLMAFVIQFYCAFCLLTYAVNVALLVCAARSLNRPLPHAIAAAGPSLQALMPSRARPAVGVFWGILLVGMVGTVGVHLSTTFVSRGNMGAMRKQMRDFLAKQPRVTIDTTGDPVLGQPGGWLQIVEFSDFLCPACQRSSRLNPIILASHRRDAALVFKHYPLDTSCNARIQNMLHPGACTVAAVSECVHLQGKFWAFHDLVFAKGHDYNVGAVEKDVAKLGIDMDQYHACMAAGRGLEAVQRDIAEAQKIGVLSTPTYIINGVPMAGGINPMIFEDFLAVLRENDR